jgi:two-component system LytT family sensor kinase
MRHPLTPKLDHYFWLFHAAVWGVFILINFITRQFNGIESLEQGLVSLVVLLLVNTLLCLCLRWVLHRFAWLQPTSPAVWCQLVLMVVALGFVSAMLSTLGVGLYYLLFGHASTLVFFMVTVYQNWLVLTLMLGIWTVVYLTINHLRQLNHLQSQQHQTQLRLKEAELNNLSGQLNPHFLFNGLNNIRALINEDPGKARHMLTELSDLLRYALTAPKQQFTPLRQELDMVRACVQLAQIQYEERLHYEEHIAAGLNDVQLPPLMIQLLVENAIRHGIDHHTGPGTLSLNITANDNRLRVEVTNPGTLSAQPSTSSGIGLNNIRKRLALLFGDQQSCALQQQGKQVVATLTLPLIREHTA